MIVPTLTTKIDGESTDAKLLGIGAGTNEIRRMLIGRQLSGAAG